MVLENGATDEESRSEPKTIAEGDYVRLRAELEKAVRRLCPLWMADKREDLVQGALVRLLETERRSREAGEKKRELAPSYLWRMATTAMIDEIRRQRRRREVEIDDAIEGGLASGAPGAAQRFEGREVGRALRDCLQAMAESRRLAVTLHLQGYPVAEAADLLDWAVKKVYNLVHRGLHDLRACLESKGIEP